MTDKALTPEEARDDSFILSAAMDVTLVANGIKFDRKKFAATLRAYADQADALTRLAALEEAVGEWARAKQAYDEADADPLISPKDFEAAFAVFDAAEARLRALQEK